jgi:phage-related protein
MFHITADTLEKVVRVSDFSSFSQTLDLLIHQWAVAEKTMGVAEIFDLLGVFQQIINQIHEIFRLNFFHEDYTNAIKDINGFKKGLEKYPEIMNDEQMQQIGFDEVNGWNIITLNPMEINPDHLKRVCLHIIKYCIEILTAKLGAIVTTFEIRKRVISYIFGNWKQIENLNLIEDLFHILLE